MTTKRSPDAKKEQAYVFRWMKAVVAEGNRLEPRAHSLALVLVTFANGDGRNCFPSVTTIGKHMNASRSTVFRAMADLERAGLLRRRDRPDGNSSVYELTLPQAIDEAASDDAGGVTGDTSPSLTRDTPWVSPVTPIPTHVPAQSDLPRKQERGIDVAPLVRALIRPIAIHVEAMDSQEQARRVWRAANVERAAREAVEAGRTVEHVELALNECWMYEAKDWVGFAVSLLHRVRDGLSLPEPPEPVPGDPDDIEAVLEWVEHELPRGFMDGEAGSALNMAEKDVPPRMIRNTLNKRRLRAVCPELRTLGER